ncbi:MAG: hypothetical protein GY898_32180 [Proteobacteria bacterium]|nr:hypothetical protein [Pseudomonadota bacterium]
MDDDGDGQSECDGDCDDPDDANFDGNAEVCDALDNDCNGAPDFGLDPFEHLGTFEGGNPNFIAGDVYIVDSPVTITEIGIHAQDPIGGAVVTAVVYSRLDEDQAWTLESDTLMPTVPAAYDWS